MQTAANIDTFGTPGPSSSTGVRDGLGKDAVASAGGCHQRIPAAAGNRRSKTSRRSMRIWPPRTGGEQTKSTPDYGAAADVTACQAPALLLAMTASLFLGMGSEAEHARLAEITRIVEASEKADDMGTARELVCVVGGEMIEGRLR